MPKKGRQNMATIEYLTNRVAGAEAKVEKLEKKLDRINKAEATGWQVNPYSYHEWDKRYTVKDLDEARKNLEKYKADLQTATEKANSRNVEAILKFLENWKTKWSVFYCVGFVKYYEERNNVRKMFESAKWHSEEYEAAKEASEELYNKVHGYYIRKEEVINGKIYRHTEKVKKGEYEDYLPYIGEKTIETAKAKMTKDLTDDANAKYDDIIERTNKIVGKITDASHLSVGEKGELNGIIYGTRGKARVETIGAGGYNIQCFHFRTLIHEVK